MNHKINYYKMVLEGSHYDIGKKNGQYIAEFLPGVKEWLLAKPESANGMTEEEALQRCGLLEQYSKGLGEELKGMAEGLGVGLNEINNILNAYQTRKPCACTIAAMAPDKTEDGHAYIGQSYEFNFDDEYTFNIHRAEGSYSHMGFSFYGVGRFDGINEKGLCAAITGLDFVAPSFGEADGFPFPFIVRILLDTCADTREAVRKMKSLPICTNANIMIGDKSGDIVIMEILTKSGKASLVERKADPYVYGVNHYLTEEHQKQYPMKRYFSHIREVCMKNFFLTNDKISKDKLQDVFRMKIPNGVCCHAYTEGFGTLRSMFYDVTASGLYVCFGSPQQYGYQKMDLWEAPAIEKIAVEFINENVPDTFWEYVE